MSHLILDKHHNLSCQCGAISVSKSAWAVMSEHKRLEIKEKANACKTCKMYKKAREKRK